MPRFVLLLLTVLVLVACGRVGAADETAGDWWALPDSIGFSGGSLDLRW
jgi:hypothetical protein